MKTLLAFLFLCLSGANTLLQACGGGYLPSQPRPLCEVRTYDAENDLDWTQNTFEYYKLVNGLTVSSTLTSPFHEPPGNIPNVYAFSSSLSKDYVYGEGWRYVKHKFGTPAQGINNPWFVLYNKHSGILRIFIAIDEILDDKSHAQISLSWWGGKKTAALDHYSGNDYTNVLEYFVDGEGKEPNVFVNTVAPPFWLHADFIINYDPCTCNYSSQLQFEAFLVEESDLSFILSGEINQLDLEADDAGMIGGNSASGTLAKAKSLTEGFVGGVKAIGSGASTIGKIFTAAGEPQPARPAVYDPFGNVITLATPAVPGISAGTINTFADVVSLFSGGGAIISGAIKVFGLFVGSSPSAIPVPPPKPLKFKVDLQASGEITSSESYIDVAFETPGGDHEGVVQGFIPHYDKIMGIFNLIEANIRIERDQIGIEIPNNNDPYSVVIDAMRVSLIEPLEYVLNPNAGIDHYEYDLDYNYIKAAYEFTGPNGRVFTSEYFDLNCFAEYGAYWDVLSILEEVDGDMPNANAQDFFTAERLGTIRIKIMAMFSTYSNIRIPYVNRFRPIIREYDSVIFGPPESDNPGGSIFPGEDCLAGYPHYPLQADPQRVSEICNSDIYQQRSGQRFVDGPTLPKDNEEASLFSQLGLENIQERELNYDEIVVYPNPTAQEGRFTLRYGLAEAGPIKISIVDQQGSVVKVVLDESIHYPGIYDIAVHVPGLSSGTYFILRQTKEGVSRGAIVVQ